MPDPFPHFVVIGAAVIDRIGRLDGPVIAAASNPGRMETHPGGVGFNVARVAAALGARVDFYTGLGEDAEAMTLRETAAAAGVRLAELGAGGGTATASWTAILDPTGNLVLGLADMIAIERLTPRDIGVAAEAVQRADALFLDANLPAEVLRRAASLPRAGRLAAGAVSPAKAPRLARILADLDVLFCNVREAAALLAITLPAAEERAALLAAALARLEVRRAVVTDGAAGLAVLDRGSVHRLAALPAPAVDGTGAGDALAAASLTGLIAEGDLLASVRDLGLPAARLAAQSRGAVPPGLSRAALTCQQQTATPRKTRS